MSAAAKIPTPIGRTPFARDAALSSRGTASYTGEQQPWEETRAAWLAAIASEQLRDFPVPSLHELAIDSRDGALTRGGGGLAYTPHGWSQLVSLMRAGAPSGLAAVMRWQDPMTRHHGWRHVVKESKRPKTEEGIMRTFIDAGSGLRAVRAVVSGRHSLEAFDDTNVLAVLDSMDAASRADNEAPARRLNKAHVSRGWDATHAHFSMAAVQGASLGFTMTNSETGCASLSFYGHLHLSTLDVQVMMPNAVPQEVAVQIAAISGASRRRHTLPRYDSRTGDELSPAARTAIAADRIEESVEKAIAASTVLADKWLTAHMDINPTAIELARLVAEGDDTAKKVLSDLLIEHGVGLGSDTEATEAIISIMADDRRLAKLPAGSAAYMAAALAVYARNGKRTWDEARELMQLAGKFIVEGWSK